MVSVSDLLSEVLPSTAKLLGGAGGVQRQVTWAATMRTRPPAFEALQGGEMALLSLSALSALQEVDSSLMLAKVIQSLDEAAVAAVAVAGLEEQRSSEDAQRAIALADERSLPLIALPRQPPLMDIERDSIAYVVSRRGGVEQQAGEVYQELLALSLRRAGVHEMIERLAAMLHKAAVLEDTGGRLLDAAAPADLAWADMGQVERLIAAYPARALFAGAGPVSREMRNWRSLHPLIERQDFGPSGLARLVTPVRLSYGIAGYCSLVDRVQHLETLDRLALGQVAPLIALELARVQELAEVQQRLHGDVFDELLTGQGGDHAQALARARQLGYDLSGPSVVVVAEALAAEAALSAGEPAEAAVSETPAWARRVIAEAERCFPGVWARMRPPELVLLVPGEDGAGSDAWFARARDRLNDLLARLGQWGPQEGLSVGVGRLASGPEELAQRYQEARQALMIGRRIFDGRPVTYFGELGIYRLLFHLYAYDDVRAFYDEVLGPLIAYDRRTENELVQTLEVYFACNGNLSEAARRLHLHRNSLLYRLERIQEILHANLEDADTRLSLQVALKMRHMLSS
jgi:purine catabolism regulator